MCTVSKLEDNRIDCTPPEDRPNKNAKDTSCDDDTRALMVRNIPLCHSGSDCWGRLAAWHLPGGPVGSPAWRTTTSNVGVGSGTEEDAWGPLATEGGLSLDKLFAGPPPRVPSYTTARGACLPNQPGPV